MSIENTNNINFYCIRKRKSKMASSEVKKQLMCYHDPFSGATSQPKIPDGKCTTSIGFSTQAVEEISNAQGQNTMHMLLWPGLNAALIVEDSDQAGLSRNHYLPEFQSSGACDWADILGGAGGEVDTSTKYAKWRVVSCGLQLKLLNSVEEDDGWWECCRVNETVDHGDWLLSTTGNNPDVSAAAFGVCAPITLLSNLQNRNITNEPTYQTGLLRDLNRVQFECHPIMNEHDFKIGKDSIRLEAADYTLNATTDVAVFDQGSAEVHQVIENFTDFSHDMVYIRLHCRPNDGSTTFGSRFHTNVVMNQEIIYDTDTPFARYQTRAFNIGDGNMDAHVRHRRGHGGAANLVI